jgi:hypothetical protein
MDAVPQLPPEQLAALAKENQSPKVIALVATFTALAFVCVCLRFLSRIKFVGLVGMEDYFIIISMVFSVATSACLIEGAKWGNGRHMLTLPMENGPWIMKYLFFSIIAYHISLTSTKLSILLQYRRIFTLKEARRPIYFAMGLCLACGTVAVVCAIFTCVPVDAYWYMMKRPFSRCVNQDAMYHANAALNISTDLLVAALPVRAIWRLQIAMRQKIALLFILTLGWFVVVVSIIRLYILIQVANHPMDTTWYGGPTAYWSVIEVNLAIVCASTPCLKPLIVQIIPGFASRIGSKRTNDNSDHTVQSKESRDHRSFMRLKGKPSQRTMIENIDLEPGVAALPYAEMHLGEIHVTRDFEQRSANEGRPSDSDSQKDLFTAYPAPVARR